MPSGRDLASAHHDGLSFPAVRAGLLAPFAPLAVVAAAVVLFNAAGIVFHLWHPAPKDPWNAALTVTAARHLQGLPVYADPALDQASTMYGPLVPLLTSWLFHLFGVSVLTGKLLSLTASLGVVGLVLTNTASRDPRAWLIGGALLFACNHNAYFYFVDARPDMVAIFFALVALLLFADWERRPRAWTLILSLAMFVLAFLAKQPLAAAALVPAVAEALRGGGLSRRRLATFGFTALPLVAVLLAIASIRWANPTAHFYMVTLPATYPVLPVTALRIGFDLALMYAPLLLVAFDLVTRPARPSDARGRWWSAAVGVFLIAGVVTMAKAGGARNSLLPLFIASAGFLTLQLPRAYGFLDDRTLSIGRRLAASAILVVMLLAFAARRPGEAVAAFVSVHGDASYHDVVALARTLPGPVRCPEDPTIPLLARGELTRSLYFEMDAAYWPARLPAYVDDEIAAARHVIQVNGPFQRLLTDEWLSRLGFGAVPDRTLERSVYRLWTKD